MTLRQYAKKCNTSHQTVSKAISQGKISDGYDKTTERIIPEIADLEWGLEFIQRNSIKKLKAKDDEEINDDNWDPFAKEDDIAQGTNITELIRLDALYKARMAKLKVEQAVEKLVNKDAMYKEMFEFGKEIRMAMQAIPDRVIDQLISLDRNQAHKMLNEAINEALEKLAEKDETGN